MKRTAQAARARDQPPHGFALIPALFLIVVLGALALVAIRVGIGQQQAVTMSLEESRALAAAQAGDAASNSAAARSAAMRSLVCISWRSNKCR